MKYIVFGDIHSNLAALQAFRKELLKQEGAKLICLGDIIGYCSSPNECVDWIRKNKIPCVMGNHDYAAESPSIRLGFNPYAREAIEWHVSILHRKNRRFLHDLPFQFSFNTCSTITHADFTGTKLFPYILIEEDASTSFRFLGTQVGFFGHTHLPGYFVQGNISHNQKMLVWNPIAEDGIELFLKEENRYLINPGSVGQPRDGNERGAYLIYDDDCAKVLFKRFEYDIEAESHRIVQMKLPSFLAERLKYGI